MSNNRIEEYTGIFTKRKGTILGFPKYSKTPAKQIRTSFGINTQLAYICVLLRKHKFAFACKFFFFSKFAL